MSSDLKLGQSFCLLQGLQPTVFLSQTPLTPSEKPALYEKNPVLKNPDLEAKWDDYPVISLHESAEELVSALQQITLRPSSFEDDSCEGGGVPSWPTGALTLAGLSADKLKQALAALSAEIGLDLSQPGMSYALVRRSCKLGTPCIQTGLFRHVDPEGTVRPETMQALKKLEKKKQSYEVSGSGAQGYLDFYKAFGSHFICGVDKGDNLFQVSDSCTSWVMNALWNGRHRFYNESVYVCSCSLASSPGSLLIESLVHTDCACARFSIKSCSGLNTK